MYPFETLLCFYCRTHMQQMHACMHVWKYIIHNINIMSYSVPLCLQVSVYRHGEKIPEAKPTLTPKTLIPPKLPIEIPQPKTQPAPSPAPSSPSPAPPKAATGRGVKSPTPTRRK